MALNENNSRNDLYMQSPTDEVPTERIEQEAKPNAIFPETYVIKWEDGNWEDGNLIDSTSYREVTQVKVNDQELTNLKMFNSPRKTGGYRYALKAVCNGIAAKLTDNDKTNVRNRLYGLQTVLKNHNCTVEISMRYPDIWLVNKANYDRKKFSSIQNGDYAYVYNDDSAKPELVMFVKQTNPVCSLWNDSNRYYVSIATATNVPQDDKKWSASDDGLGCVQIKREDYYDFEASILNPYFNMTLDELFFGTTAGEDNPDNDEDEKDADEQEDEASEEYQDSPTPDTQDFPGDADKPLLSVTEDDEDVKYTKTDFLNEVFMDGNRYDTLKKLLERKKNIILQGAPGVGKTFMAKRLAYSLMGKKDDSRIAFVQFHQNYSYEDFIMGYRPQKNGGFALQEGSFYKFCKSAEENHEQDYFFIIDEINRGNMSKILGELMFLIEKDYRGTEVTLPYTDENGESLTFAVPENLYIVGMMNTADRSLAMIDYALRRRFGFFEVEPGFKSKGFTTMQENLNNNTFKDLIKTITDLNGEIAKDTALGRGFRIGHSYFCGCEKPEDCTTEWMRSIIDFDVIPLLEEFWFDEPDKVNKWKREFETVLPQNNNIEEQPNEQ